MNAVSTLLPTVATGFGFGLSLIVAIGAQNAFVLRQGLRREHVLPVVLICALSDLLLIGAGVGGVGFVVHRVPLAVVVVRWAGAAFLLGYALLAARRACTPRSLTAGPAGGAPLRMVVLTCLALTWLNPHVYLDTVLLLGSVASAHGGAGRWLFGAGAAAASAVWFTGLGFGARLLGGVFARPAAWRVLDAGIAVVMAAIGLRLVLPS